MKRGREGEGEGPKNLPRPFSTHTDTAPERDPFHRPRDGAAELPYLEQGVRIEPGILRDHAGFAVMMPWETPLMVRAYTPRLRTCDAHFCSPQLHPLGRFAVELCCVTSRCKAHVLCQEAHADFVCRGDEGSSCRPAAVLNVGFGMGIVDTAIQLQEPHNHIIVEAHPQVVERAREWAKKRPNVQVIHRCL